MRLAGGPVCTPQTLNKCICLHVRTWASAEFDFESGVEIVWHVGFLLRPVFSRCLTWKEKAIQARNIFPETHSLSQPESTWEKESLESSGLGGSGNGDGYF